MLGDLVASGALVLVFQSIVVVTASSSSNPALAQVQLVLQVVTNLLGGFAVVDLGCGWAWYVDAVARHFRVEQVRQECGQRQARIFAWRLGKRDGAR